MQLEKKLSSFGGVPLTHGALVSMLKEYRSPNDKIARLIEAGWLVPIKKGLYAVSPEQTTIPISIPLVANILYGASYISMDYALYHYGIIPERVVEVTSMTTKRGKVYDLPIGRFSYTHSPLYFYPVGIDRVENTDKTGFLMASPEKALCDKLVFTRNLNISSPCALQELLFDDLRLDEESITRFDPKVIKACIMPGGMKEKMLLALLELVSTMKRVLK